MVFDETMDGANHRFGAAALRQAAEPQLQLTPIFSENDFSQVYDDGNGILPFLFFDDEDEDDMDDEDNFDDMDDDYEDDFDDDDFDDEEDDDYDDDEEDYDYEEDVDYDDFDE